MSHTIRTTAAATIGSALLVAMVVLAPAVSADTTTAPGQQRSTTADAAEHRAGAADHDGDADSGADTAYTEDTDTNDGGTADDVADAGDDRHPSGKDRSVERSPGAQGGSESDPDDDGRGPDRSNGGPDKPNGAGGVDLADQDGNNGCGNDDDFEDDNEGWCGHKHDTTVAPVTADSADHHLSTDAAPCEHTDSMAGDSDTCDAAAAATEVLGAEAEAPALDDTPLAAAGTIGTEVMAAAATAELARAATAETADAPVEGELPMTGAMITTLLGAAAMAVISGLTFVRAGRGRADDSAAR